MTRLLIATTNPAKLAEYRILLGEGLEPVSLAEIGITDHPEETGATFTENALLKARFYFARAQIPTLADDGGFEVDALGGEPGVKSHRWLGADHSDDQALVDEVIRRMREVEPARRTARLRAALALVYADGSAICERVAEAALEGVVPERAWPHVRPGFPYRSVMFLPDRGRYVAELTEEQSAQLSQRRIALAELRDDLALIAKAQVISGARPARDSVR
jgi:XTP/dITP diphosphohydrolase